MSEKPKIDLGLLEEDDEFEEFPVEGKFIDKMRKQIYWGYVSDLHFLILFHFKDWTGKDKDEQDISVWEDNWEDDNIEDDFNKQLRYC